MVSVNNVVDEVYKKYKKFGISRELIRDCAKKISFNSDNERYCINKTSIQIDGIIVNNTKKDKKIEIIINHYSYIKSLIEKNKEIKNDIIDYANKNNLSFVGAVERIYIETIKNIMSEKYDYNYEKLLSENILNSVKSYITRPSKSIDVQVDDKRSYDISCLQILLRTSYISINKLSEHTKIDSTKLYQYIYLNKPIPGYEFAKVLEHFNTTSYDKFIDFVINYEENLPKTKKIAQFKTIIEESITRNKYYLENKLEVNIEEQKDDISSSIANNTTKPRKEKKEKISILEDDSSKKDTKQKKKPNFKEKEERYNISFLKPWLKNNNVTQQALAKYLNISNFSATKYLSGEILAPKEVVNKLIKLFKVKDYEELKTKTIKNELEVPEELIRKKSKEVINKTDTILEDNNNKETTPVISNVINQEICKDISMGDNQIFNIVTNAQKMVNIEYLLNMIDLNTIPKFDYIIIMLLFGGIETKDEIRYYSMHAISNFFKVDVKYVHDIYLKCLKLYRDKFSNMLNDINSLKLENLDGNSNLEV